MKILTIVGARPQFIKAAAVSRILRGSPGHSEVLVHTGQHYDENLSDIFFREMGMPEPEYQLRIGSGPHGAQTGRMLEAIEKVLLKESPDRVLVYGDTNSTVAGALAASKLHIPIAHVEAGLRSFNRRMPEEINRVLTDHLADLLFAPTRAAVDNLSHEGISPTKVHEVGDVMYDAALYYARKSDQQSTVLAKLNASAQGYVLATIHRAENTSCPEMLRNILQSLTELSSACPVVMPVHPRTRAAMRSASLDVIYRKNLLMIDPVGYLDMVMLEKNAKLIVTDSGGVQKEAYFYKVPCATLRGETEWVELVECGWNTLVSPLDKHMTEQLLALLSKPFADLAHPDFYGVGDTAEQIVTTISEVRA